MPKYIALLNWTDQGVRAFRESTDRADAAAKLFESVGGSMVEIYWTLGPYDVVAITEFPDDETATAALLLTAETGNVRTTTMRAFDRAGIRAVMDKTG
jgi:uncharacterized protein with GYD domain